MTKLQTRSLTFVRTDRLLASVLAGTQRAKIALNLDFRTTILRILLFCLAAVIVSPAQSVVFTTLASFDGSNGAQPFLMTLVQGSDGNFYGTTHSGGAYNQGTVFKITPTGSLTTLYSFCSQPNCADGYFPEAGLILATDGNFYGTASAGGGDFGTVFRITPSGTLTTLHTFQGGKEGIMPIGALVQASDGNFYGTTNNGGVSDNCLLGCGTAFKMTSDGTLTTLYSFCSQPNCTDGGNPTGGLVQGADGDLYGTTASGGGNCGACGTVFKITSAGALTTLYSFCSQQNCTDGDLPQAGLIKATDGSFYGTTLGGGNTSGDCNFYFTFGCGTVFKITASGTLTTLHAFDYTDGAGPNAALLQGIDGNFYGTAEAGGTNCPGTPGCGTTFRITPTGTVTILYSFCSLGNCADGSNPYGGLVQATNRFLYGTTYAGGNLNDCAGAGCGTVFRLLPVRECATCRQ
jgi:uncharacterized repeat protein (TIGR03803 family)